MSQNLPVSRLIRVAVDLAPLGAQGPNVNALLILGNTDVIDTNERVRTYASIAAVGEDFSTTDPEYLAAALYFAQSPQPQTLLIGRWARTATHGLLRGGILSSTELAYDFSTITGGAFDVTIDGTVRHVTGLDLSSETNLNSVASLIQAELSAWATCVFTGTRFLIQSLSTGATATVSDVTDVTDQVGALLNLTTATGAVSIDGIVAEEPVDCVEIFIDRFPRDFFGLMFADTNVDKAQHEAVADLIEADKRHIYGLTETSTDALDSTVTDDVGSEIKAQAQVQTCGQFSESEPYAVASLFGRAFTVNFEGVNTTITLMYKQEPGVTPEQLSTTEANALQNKRYNVLAAYNNGTSLLQYGTMFGPAYFDEIHNLAWLQSRIETDWFNLLYTSTTKIPQTDAGMHQLETVLEAACAQAVANGMIAPGTWTAGGFGSLKQGDFLPKGYYIFAPSVATQSTSDRAARKSVPFKVALKLAGAVHEADVILEVNR